MRACNFVIYIIFFLIFSFSCAGEAPTVVPGTVTQGYTSTTTGYYYPIHSSEYPVDGSPGVAVNSSYVILFNIPIDATTLSANLSITSTTNGALTGGGVDYTISPIIGDTTLVTITFNYGGANPLLPSDTISVNLASGIVDSKNGVPLNNPGPIGFQTTTNASEVPDIVDPIISGGTANPADGAINVSLTAPDIRINFTEATPGEIDISTINNTTFYLSEGGDTVAATYTYTAATNQATLTPVETLVKNTLYTVTVTTGIKDLSGNSLAAGTSWTFTTVNVDDDPEPGVPTITDGPLISALTDTTATLGWTTSEATNYTLNYGRGDDTALNVGDLINFTPFHSVLLNPPLLAGKRYWVNVDYNDYVGTPGVVSSTVEFNTITDEVPSIVHDGAGSQHTLNYIKRERTASSSGAIAFWTSNSGNNHIYGQLYNDTFTGQWNTGNPVPIFTEGGQDFTYLFSVEDEVYPEGGVIVLASNGGSGIYAKRVDKDGNFVWGDPANDATDRGIEIDVAGSNVAAVPVYTGMIQKVTSGTVEHGSMGLANYFFDNDVDLSGLTDGDIIMDPNNHDGTTIDNNTVFQDFSWILGQDASVITSGDSYIIGDATIDTMTDTTANHTKGIAGTVQTNTDGTNIIYTSHAFIPPTWLNVGDIVKVGSTYVQITAITPEISLVDSGTGDGTGVPTDHLVDSSKNWTVALLNYVARNTNDNKYEKITNVTLTDLTLVTLGVGSNIFPLGTEPYEIYDDFCSLHGASNFGFYKITVDANVDIATNPSINIYDNTGVTGVADTPPTNPLYDETGDFLNATLPFPVLNSDIVVNTTTSNVATVTNATRSKAVDLDSNIFSDGDSYNIIRFNYGNTSVTDIKDKGNADGTTAGHLIDSSNNFALVNVGDIAYNLTDDDYAIVTAKLANDLTLSKDASFGIGDSYLIIRRRGVMYMWQEGANIQCKILSMVGSPPIELKNEHFIVNGTDSHLISDGNGNAIGIYVDINGEVQAANIDGYAFATNWVVEIDTQSAVVETIVDVQSDGAGGVIILYKYNDDLHVQKIDNLGARQWGVNGYTVFTATTSQESMQYISPDSVVVVANTGNNIIAARVGVSSWTSVDITSLAGSIQQNPKLFVNGANSIILWDDNRFLLDSGYGIFGMKINISTGAKDATWNANLSGTNDTNGISLILNNYSEYSTIPSIIPYDNSTRSTLIWEDYRAGQINDLKYMNLDGFIP